LLVIGVHRPEFEFEKDYASVEAAVREAGIEYPVVLDNDAATWDAYGNRYWPAWYLIDADGFVSYRHFGEGAYEETEEKIQALLAERDEVSARRSRPAARHHRVSRSSPAEASLTHAGAVERRTHSDVHEFRAINGLSASRCEKSATPAAVA
jgi:hypothetical protein